VRKQACTYPGVARTVYIHCIWPCIWWFPCQYYRYIWGSGQPYTYWIATWHEHGSFPRLCASAFSRGAGGATQRWCHTEVVPHRGGATQRWCHTQVVPHRGGATQSWASHFKHTSKHASHFKHTPCVPFLSTPHASHFKHASKHGATQSWASHFKHTSKQPAFCCSYQVHRLFRLTIHDSNRTKQRHHHIQIMRQ